MERSSQGQAGQALVEFLLAAPFLFMVFFGILQLFYVSIFSLTLQHAAFGMVREYSLTGDPQDSAIDGKFLVAMAPLARLDRRALAGIAASSASFTLSMDRKYATIHLRYPIPLWVPGMGRVFGSPFLPGTRALPLRLSARAERLSSSTGIPFPTGTATRSFYWVKWMEFTATAPYEGRDTGKGS